MVSALTHVTRDEERDVELKPLKFFGLMRRIFGYAPPIAASSSSWHHHRRPEHPASHACARPQFGH